MWRKKRLTPVGESLQCVVMGTNDTPRRRTTEELIRTVFARARDLGARFEGDLVIGQIGDRNEPGRYHWAVCYQWMGSIIPIVVDPEEDFTAALEKLIVKLEDWFHKYGPGRR